MPDMSVQQLQPKSNLNSESSTKNSTTSSKKSLNSATGLKNLVSSPRTNLNQNSPSRSSKYDSKPRPFLLWKVMQRTAEIMALGTFGGKDPMESNWMFENIDKESMEKRLLNLKPKQRNDLFLGENLSDLYDDTYLLIKPIIVSLKQNWKQFPVGPFNNRQLLFINETIRDILLHGIDQQKRFLDSRDDSAESPIPQTRSHAFEYNIESINKDAQIFEWLKDGKKIHIHTQNTSSFYSDLVTADDAYTELSLIYNDQQSVDGIDQLLADQDQDPIDRVLHELS